MTYAEIQAFLAVAESGSMTRAAEKLFVSQSTLSGRICALEEEFGMTMFLRGKGIRNTELTEQGRDFMAVAEKWERLWRETQAMAVKEHCRVLRTSAIYSINDYILPEVYARFAAENPEVRLHLLIRHSVDSYALVENGEAEAAFITKPQYSKKVDTSPLFREKMIFLCAEGSRYGESVSPSDLNANDEILLDWHREFFQWHDYWFGPACVPKLYTDDLALMEHFLEDGDAWAVVPISAVQMLEKNKKIRQCSLRDEPRGRTVYMLTQALRERSPELSALLRDMKSVLLKKGAQWVLDRE